MPRFEEDIKHMIRRSVGTTFWIKKTLTSSGIPQNTTPSKLTTAATGKLYIKQVVLQTDSSGLTTGTNFELATSNSKGLLKFAVETVANLGANVTKVLSGAPPAGDTTTGDTGMTVSAAQTVLEAGSYITYANSVAAGTTTGTMDVYIQFERIEDNAFLYAA